MSLGKKKTLKAYAMDGIVMGAVSVLVYTVMMFLQPQSPYENQKITNISKVKGGIIVSATFIEGMCSFRTMSVYGETDGSQTVANWTHLDPTIDRYKDRKAGKAKLSIKVFTFDSAPEYIELMTHHDCGEEHVYKRFARIDVRGLPSSN